jgi:hypothetical protein
MPLPGTDCHLLLLLLLQVTVCSPLVCPLLFLLTLMLLPGTRGTGMSSATTCSSRTALLLHDMLPFQLPLLLLFSYQTGQRRR